MKKKQKTNERPVVLRLTNDEGSLLLELLQDELGSLGNLRAAHNLTTIKGEPPLFDTEQLEHLEQATRLCLKLSLELVAQPGVTLWEEEPKQ